MKKITLKLRLKRVENDLKKIKIRMELKEMEIECLQKHAEVMNNRMRLTQWDLYAKPHPDGLKQ